MLSASRRRHRNCSDAPQMSGDRGLKTARKRWKVKRGRFHGAHDLLLKRTFLTATLLLMTMAMVSVASARGSDGGPLLQRDAIVDLALLLDDDAFAALEASHDSDVPGRLIVGARDSNGGPEIVDVVVHVKGGKGSRRSFDDKPALKIRTANGRRVFGL